MDKNIFDIEADKKILDIVDGNGNPIWFYMRDLVLMQLLPKYLYGAKATGAQRSNKISSLNYIFRSLIHNISYYIKNQSPKKIVFYSISRKYDKGGKYYNKYTDYFADIDRQNVLTVEHAPLDWSFPNVRHNKEVLYSAPVMTMGTIIGKFFDKKNKIKIIKLTNYVLEQITKYYGVNLTKKDKIFLIKQTNVEIQKMHFFCKWYIKICDRFNIKKAVFIPGPYLRYCELVKCLKDKGIRTAFYQDGIKTKNDVNGNVNINLIKEEKLERAIPNDYLTFGKWWNDQRDLPYEYIYELGNPHHSECLNKIKRRVTNNDILLIGCANNTLEYLKLAKYLIKHFPDKRIVFRPHPTELIETQKLIYNFDGIELDTNELYLSLSSASSVISEVSTVLYEAIGIVPQIIVWRTEYSKWIMPDNPFDSFEKYDELVRIINEKNPTTIDNNDFWYKDWKNAFIRYENLDN